MDHRRALEEIMEHCRSARRIAEALDDGMLVYFVEMTMLEAGGKLEAFFALQPLKQADWKDQPKR